MIHEAEKSNGVNFPLIVSQLAVLRAWNEESASLDKRGGGVDEGDWHRVEGEKQVKSKGWAKEPRGLSTARQVLMMLSQ